MGLTYRDHERIRDWIRTFTAHAGYGPNVREVRDGLALSSTSVADYRIRAAIDAGYLIRDPQTARSIRATGDTTACLPLRQKHPHPSPPDPPNQTSLLNLVLVSACVIASITARQSRTGGIVRRQSRLKSQGVHPTRIRLRPITSRLHSKPRDVSRSVNATIGAALTDNRRLGVGSENQLRHQ
jgi:hypothetical protein